MLYQMYAYVPTEDYLEVAYRWPDAIPVLEGEYYLLVFTNKDLINIKDEHNTKRFRHLNTQDTISEMESLTKDWFVCDKIVAKETLEYFNPIIEEEI